jgi:hypothetical protein
METINLLEGIDTLLKKFGRLIIYRKVIDGNVFDRVIEVCLTVRTRLQGRIEPYEVMIPGISDKTGYQILIEAKHGFVPSIDDLVFIPKCDGKVITNPPVILDYLRVTNVSDIFYQSATIAYNVYCVREERLRGVFSGKS